MAEQITDSSSLLLSDIELESLRKPTAAVTATMASSGFAHSASVDEGGHYQTATALTVASNDARSVAHPSPGGLLADGPLAVGCSVVIGGSKHGTLRYCGPVHFASDVWCGVELCAADVAAGGGKNDGSVRDVRYFSCPANAGIFVPISRVVLDTSPANGSDGDGTNGNCTQLSSLLPTSGGDMTSVLADCCGGDDLTTSDVAAGGRDGQPCLLIETFEATDVRVHEREADLSVEHTGQNLQSSTTQPLQRRMAAEKSNPGSSPLDGDNDTACAAASVHDGYHRSQAPQCISNGSCPRQRQTADEWLLGDSPGDDSLGIAALSPQFDESPPAIALGSSCHRDGVSSTVSQCVGDTERKALGLLGLSRRMAAAAAAAASGSPVGLSAARQSAVSAGYACSASAPSVSALLTTAVANGEREPDRADPDALLSRSIELFSLPKSWDIEQTAVSDHWLPDDDIANLIQLESLALAKQFEAQASAADAASGGSLSGSLGQPGTPAGCDTPQELPIKPDASEAVKVLTVIAGSARPDVTYDNASLLSMTSCDPSACDSADLGATSPLDGTFVLAGDGAPPTANVNRTTIVTTTAGLAGTSRPTHGEEPYAAKQTGYAATSGEAAAGPADDDDGDSVADVGTALRSCEPSTDACVSDDHSPALFRKQSVLNTTVTLAFDENATGVRQHATIGDLEAVLDTDCCDAGSRDSPLAGELANGSRQSSLDSLIEFADLRDPADCSTPSVTTEPASGQRQSRCRQPRRSAAAAASDRASSTDGRGPEIGAAKKGGSRSGSGASCPGVELKNDGTPSPRPSKAARDKQCAAAGGATVTRKPAVSKLAEYIVSGSNGNAEKDSQPAQQQQQHVKRNPPRSRWAGISKQLEESRTAAAAAQQQPRPKSAAADAAPPAASRRATLGGDACTDLNRAADAADGVVRDESRGSSSTKDVASQQRQQQHRRQTIAPSSLKNPALAMPTALSSTAGQRTSLIVPSTFKAPLPRPSSGLTLPVVRRRENGTAASAVSAAAAAPAAAGSSSAAAATAPVGMHRSASVASVSSETSQASMGAAESASAADACGSEPGPSKRRQPSSVPSSAVAANAHAAGRRSLLRSSERRLKSPLPATSAAVAAAATSSSNHHATAATTGAAAANHATAGPASVRRLLPQPKKHATASSAGEVGRHPTSKSVALPPRAADGIKASTLVRPVQQLPVQQLPATEDSANNVDAASIERAASPTHPDVVPSAPLQQQHEGNDESPSTASSLPQAPQANLSGVSRKDDDSSDVGDQVDAGCLNSTQDKPSTATVSEEALAAAEAQLTAALERERLLKADGTRRELENAHLRSEHRRLGAAVAALAVLLRYTTDELQAFATPGLAARVHDLERQLLESNTRADHLDEKLRAEAAASVLAAAEHETRASRLQEEHAEAISELYAQIEAIKASTAEEVSYLKAQATEENTNLQNKLQTLEKERDELRDQYKRVEDALTKDADVKVQLALSPYKHLPKEVESLMTVVDLKNAEIQKLRKENNENRKQIEELRAGCDRASMLEQRVESLEAAVETRTRSERELQDRYDELARRCELESREKLRLSMNCEELQYRLQDVTACTSADSSISGSPAAAMHRSFALPSPRAPGLAWNGATMTTSLYEPLSSSPSEVATSHVKMRRSQSSGVASGAQQQRRRRLSYETEGNSPSSAAAAAPPSTPSLPEQHETTADDRLPEASSESSDSDPSRLCTTPMPDAPLSPDKCIVSPSSVSAASDDASKPAGSSRSPHSDSHTTDYDTASSSVADDRVPHSPNLAIEHSTSDVAVPHSPSMAIKQTASDAAALCSPTLAIKQLASGAVAHRRQGGSVGSPSKAAVKVLAANGIGSGASATTVVHSPSTETDV